jgi:antitoxin HigA-1
MKMERQMTSILPPIHPGEILMEEFLVPMDMSAGTLAKALGVPRTRVERLVTKKTGITPDTALRLAKYLGTSPEFWMNMQSGYDLKTAAASGRIDFDKIEAVRNDNYAEVRLTA